jgi:hypothetical protein
MLSSPPGMLNSMFVLNESVLAGGSCMPALFWNIDSANCTICCRFRRQMAQAEPARLLSRFNRLSGSVLKSD